MSAIYTFLMLLNSLVGVNQTGNAYHIDSSTASYIRSSSAFQQLESSGAVKLNGNGSNLIVIVDQNEL
jgi:hypothetical membrane protein